MRLVLASLAAALGCQAPQSTPPGRPDLAQPGTTTATDAADPAELWLWEHLRDVALQAGHDPRTVPPPERLLDDLAERGEALTPAEVRTRLEGQAPWMVVEAEEDYLRDPLTVGLLEASSLPAWAPQDQSLLADGQLPPSPFWPAAINRAQRLLLLHHRTGDAGWLDQAALAVEQLLAQRPGYTYGSYLLAYARQLQDRPDAEQAALTAAGPDARAGYERFFRRPLAELVPYLEMNLLEDCMVRRGVAPRLPDLGGAASQPPQDGWRCGDLVKPLALRPMDHRLFMRMGFLDDSAERLSASMTEDPALAQPEAFLNELGLQPGMVAADIGAGLGFFTFPMARAVQPDGRVLALELDPLLVDYLGYRAAHDGVTTVLPVLNSAGDVQLEPGSVDAALLSLTLGSLFELQREPNGVDAEVVASLLASIHTALAPHGILIVIDDRGMMPSPQAAASLRAAGFADPVQPLELWSPFYALVAHKGAPSTARPPSATLCGFDRQATGAEPTERCRQAGCDTALTSAGHLEAIITPPPDCRGQELLEESWFDGAAHGFPFDLLHPEAEAARVHEALADARGAEVLLRGIYLQVGMERARDPAACQAFVDQDLGLPAWDRAFAMANGMAWSEHGSLPEKMARGAQLEGPLQDIYLEELGWQSRRIGGVDALHSALDQAPPEQRCIVRHGWVRSLTGGRASDTEALALAIEHPESCRLHVLHAAVRYRSQDDEQAQRRALAPGVGMTAWESLDHLP